MKDKIILFGIGLLVGAVITSGAFYVYTVASNKCDKNIAQMNGGQPPQLPNNGNNNRNDRRPNMPNGKENDNGEMPEKPDNKQDNTQSES